MQVSSGAVELAIGQLPYSYRFHQTTDVANTMGYRIAYLAHRVPEPIAAVWTIFYPFSTGLWVILIAGTVAVCLFLLLINTINFGLDSPNFHILAISLLSLLGESFPNYWFHYNITAQVKMILFVWLPMSFLLGSMYKSSLLQFLVAGEYEDPADTFEKVLERDLIIAMPTGSVMGELFKTAPFESMRLAYEAGKDKGGYYPWGQLAPPWIFEANKEGKVVALVTDNLEIGRRHFAQKSKVERPVGYLLNGFLFKRNSLLRRKIQPILETLIETGIYEHLKDHFLWFRAKPERDHYRVAQQRHLVVLRWGHVGWSFTIIAGFGLIWSVITFFLEFMFYKKSKNYNHKVYVANVEKWAY